MEGRDLGLVQNKDPAGWQSFELCRKGLWDERQCARMPTLCGLLKKDKAVSGWIPPQKVDAINSKGGWLPEPSVWIEPSMHGQRVLLDRSTFNNNGGYIPDQVVAILRLAPGALLMPHIGSSNARFNLHFGLRVPAGAKLKVANETRTWTVGKGLVFDESFEHSAWNENEETPRYVLQVHTWHPGLMPLVEDAPTYHLGMGDLDLKDHAHEEL